MNILKFGGTSVGSAEGIGNIRKIVGERKESVIVIVSALGGVTDALLEVSEKAVLGGDGWKGMFDAIRDRHMELISTLQPRDRRKIEDKVGSILESTRTLLEGVSILKILPEKTRNEIVSAGERMSSLIVSGSIEESVLYDPLSFIKTTTCDGRIVLDSGATEKLVKEVFSEFPPMGKVAVVPGFISTDSTTSEITNLGRGGSDYTASIIAATLSADCLEIWTDVDGFMTADPRIIKTAYVIDELSFTEAMELCNFGAKVIYPPSLYPVCDKDIPILIKNTFNPGSKGTVIRQTRKQGGSAVIGISSIEDTCMLTISGSSMAGVVGVDSRIFSALARHHISVFLVSQSSSETNISIGIRKELAEQACSILEDEFAHEIKLGSMDRVQIRKELSTVAIVGENMKDNTGIAGKLFSVLGRNGINIIAFAQGTEQRNISFVVDRKYLRKSLNVIHDSFFLSEFKELNLFVCGIGTVGGKLLEQIAGQREKLMREHNLKINVVGIIRSSKAVFNRDGLDPGDYIGALDREGIPVDTDTIRNEVIGMNIFNSVFVDCTASVKVASLYKDFFEHSISVVAANKIAASSSYDDYTSLKSLALRRGVKFLFETNVGAGLPIINTINALRNSGDRIEKIEAVVSGTLNFIFNTISADIPFSRTVMMAKEQGYSEPDPRVDLSGKDVIRKLVILSREAGYKVEQEDVEADLFIPKDFFDCSLEEFWKKLPGLDEDFEKRRRALEEGRKHWRFVACMENGRYSVSLKEFDEGHSFYVLEGSNNIILLTTERYHDHPMLIQGYGAGADVTAAGVFADIMSIANV